MKAREIRTRHFRSSVGSMLNENYEAGRTPDTVQSEDYVYIPPSVLPASRSALRFLNHKFPGPPPAKVRPTGTSESLGLAYQRAVTQPAMLIHYDRDPLYREGKAKRPEGTCPGSPGQDSGYLDPNTYCQPGLVPSDVHPASTPCSVSSTRSVRPLASCGDVRSVADAGSRGSSRPRGHKSRDGNVEDNRHRLWSPGPEAAGFKPYSPFSDSLEDLGRHEAKFVPPEIIDPVLRTCDVTNPPRYFDAYREVLNLPPNPSGSHSRPVDILKVHGTPEYPSKVINESDVGNYIAWASIYPYCPLTQVEGKDKPTFVPPRGFTPSVQSVDGASPTVPKSKTKEDILSGAAALDQVICHAVRSPRRQAMEKAKRNVMAGVVKQRPATSTLRLARETPNRTPIGSTTTSAAVYPPRRPMSSPRPHYHQHQRLGSSSEGQGHRRRSLESLGREQLTSCGGHDVSRRILEMKMLAPAGWYGGRTPSHTPTPDYSLPVKADAAWVKHFSPQRIRRFLKETEQARIPA